MDSAANHRIARNAIFLYGRMLLTIGVSLYTNRVVLDTLGVNNYGIYNIVAGIVTVFGFLNGTFASAIARFLNFELGVGDKERLAVTFSTSLKIHWLIAGIIFIASETIGLWFVNTELDIAPERMFAANVAYQFSILSSLISVVQIPYTSAIMAHEKMNVYAWIAILNTLLKLAITLMLVWFAALDTLIIYSLLMFSVTLTIGIIYRSYSRSRFGECHYRKVNDRQVMKKMLGFSGWDLYGNFCFLARVQGTIIILNRWGGTVLNAAGNLALTVTQTITSFAGNVIQAFRPQIIQQYARENYEDSFRLLWRCARFSLLLLGLIVVPLFFEMEVVLKVWLKEVPPFTATFAKISLIAACGEILISSCAVGIHATGRLVRISFIAGTLYLLELPAFYFILKWLGTPPVIYVVHCGFILLILLTDTIILKLQMPGFSMRVFWLKGVFTPVMIIVVAGLITYAVSQIGGSKIAQFFLTTGVSTLMLGVLTYCFGFDKSMRAYVKSKLRR